MRTECRLDTQRLSLTTPTLPPVPHHKFHEATETPEGIYFILNNEEDWGQEVTHTLNIA